MALAFFLHILITPSLSSLLLSKLSSPFFIQTDIDPSNEERHEKLHGKENHDGNLARNVRWCITRLEYLCAYDVSETERCQRNSVYSILWRSS